MFFLSFCVDLLFNLSYCIFILATSTEGGFGGLLREGDGYWIVGFLGSLGITDNLKAKLVAIVLPGPGELLSFFV